jgi:hypothetical protein
MDRREIALQGIENAIFAALRLRDTVLGKHEELIDLCNQLDRASNDIRDRMADLLEGEADDFVEAGKGVLNLFEREIDVVRTRVRQAD